MPRVCAQTSAGVGESVGLTLGAISFKRPEPDLLHSKYRAPEIDGFNLAVRTCAA